jgi:hypothetical protein
MPGGHEAFGSRSLVTTGLNTSDHRLRPSAEVPSPRMHRSRSQASPKTAHLSGGFPHPSALQLGGGRAALRARRPPATGSSELKYSTAVSLEGCFRRIRRQPQESSSPFAYLGCLIGIACLRPRATDKRINLDFAKLQRPPRPCGPFRYAITGQIPSPMICGFGVCAFS